MISAKRATIMVAVGMLAGCDTAADKAAKQFGMLKRSGAPRTELCSFATKTAQAYLQESNDAKFQVWETERKQTCQVAGPVTGPVVGRISGELSFPSEYIPKDMAVCARNVETRKDTCSPTHGSEKYSLELVPGRYIVWSSTKDAQGRAFYTKAVVCGLSVECKDHKPIEVEVRAGEARIKIDPGDYFATMD